MSVRINLLAIYMRESFVKYFAKVSHRKILTALIGDLLNRIEQYSCSYIDLQVLIEKSMIVLFMSLIR